MKKVNIEESWYDFLEEEFERPYFLSIRKFLKNRYKEGVVYPHPSNIFNAFNSTPVERVKVVILGQDPYHGPGQAHGLCFSVQPGIKIPPSLGNIYKELVDDLKIDYPETGDLSPWAKRGVFLLNNVLTVEGGKANSHKSIGWEKFTEYVIKKLSKEKSGIVFLLWGRQAQEKEEFIDTAKNLVLKSVHPSPLSAYNGFFGCKHFSKTNDYLIRENKNKIDWRL